MKNIKHLLMLSFIVLMALILFIGCKNKEKDKEPDDGGQDEIREWEYTADNLEDAKDIYDDFFYLTIYNDDMVVKVYTDDELLLTETLDGNKDHMEYAWGEEAYAYNEGDEYIFAVKDEHTKYYFTDEDSYYELSLAFEFFINVFSDLEADKLTVSLSSKGKSIPEGYSVHSDAVLTAEIKYEGWTSNIRAVKERDKVVSFENALTDENGTTTTKITFEFGNASVTMPDLSDWFNASAPREESEWYVCGTINGKAVESVPMYYDYLTGDYKTDNIDVIVGDKIEIKNKNDASIVFSQDIDNEMFAGHEMICFSTEDNSLYFESEE